MAREHDPEAGRLADEHAKLMASLVIHGARLSVLVERLELTTGALAEGMMGDERRAD